MSTDKDRYAWITNHVEGGFAAVSEADDFLHRDGNPPGASVTETYYFGFHVPEAALYGQIYVWFHPNLGVVTAGSMIARGFCRSSLASDYFDHRAYLALEEHVDPASGTMRFPSGLVLTPQVPMQTWRLQLDAPGQQTRFDLLATAAQPAVKRADGKHFDQNMRMTGELLLRGERYRVDCCQIRDRSWRNARPEDPMPVPPYDWLTITHGAEFSMNISMFDDLGVLGNPGGALHVPPTLLQDGWVCLGVGQEAQLRRLVEVHKRTVRTNDTLMPLRHEVTAIDDQSDRYELVGDSIGGCNWNGWPNMIWQQNLMRWTCNGQPCWGESQEVQWHETVRMLSRPRARA
jgi:hypothetical protein